MDLDTLCDAAIAGDADAIAKLEKQADILNEDEETILHTESRNGNTERVRFILREFAHKNLLGKLNKFKKTALHLAARYGRTEVASILIDAATQLPVTSFQAFLRQADQYMDTTLHLAVMYCHPSIVKLLVEADPSDTHNQNDEGETPMYIAVEKGYNDIVEIISTTCTAPSLDGPHGSTALPIKNLDQAKSPAGTLYKIIDKDALYAAAIAGDADAIAGLETRADTLDEYGRTILHIESRNGNTEPVRFILREFAHKTLLVKLDKGKKTALHLAALFGNTEVASILIDAARHMPVTSFQAFLRQGDKYMYTALHKAVMYGHASIVKLLVEADPSDTHIQNDEDKNLLAKLTIFEETALHLAVYSGRTEVGEILIDAARHLPVTSFQAFLRQPDKHMDTALHKAVERGQASIVKLLVEADPSDTHIQNNEGKTPIYIAVERGYIDIVKVICTTCTALPNLNGPGGSTALHAAFTNLDKESILSLLDDNAKQLVTFADNLGWTALHHAAYHQFDSIIGNIIETQKVFGHPFVYQDMVSTPFHVAAQKGYTSTVIGLMQSWPSSSSAYTAVDKNGQNILHLAALQCKKEMIQGVLKYCSEEYKKEFVNKQDNNGNTPLHLLIRLGCLVPELFKYRGLDIWVQNKENWTPPDMLYFEDQIIVDQVQIKIALDGIQIDPTRDVFSRPVLTISKRERKDVILKEQAKLMIHEKYAGMKGDTDAIANCFADAIAGDPISKAALEKKADTPNESGETILHVESKKGVIENVRFIVKEFANKSLLGKLDISKQTALHLAVLNGNVAIVKLLVEADPNDSHVQNNEGKTPIYIAAENGYKDIVKEICTTCPALSLDGPGGSTTALHAAILNIRHAHHGHTEVVEALIDAARHLPSSSANDDAHSPVSSFQDFIRKATDPMRNTALHLAVLNGNVAIVKLLVEADPNDRHVQNNEGKTPIYIAAENGYKDIVKEICTICTALSLDGPGGRTTALHALIQNIGQVTEGASDVIGMMVHAAKRWSSAEDPSLVNFEALFSTTDESGSTVLQLAMERNYVDAVELILQKDPAYQPGRELGRNSLMRLIDKAINNKYSDDIIKLLSKTYEDGINPDHKGVIALIVAMKMRDEDFVSRLLGDAKHLVTFTGDNGWTPLHYAVYHEFDSILGAIIEAQEDVGHQFVYANMQSTPFYLAVTHGYTSTLIRLMQSWPAPSSAVTAANSPYTAVNEFGENILHLAAADNNKEMVQGILKYCPEKYKDNILKQQDTNGDTPLHLLISHGCFIPELIKHKGLDTMPKNKNNFTPWDMLYLKNDVVDDQVLIKIALDDVQTNQSSWNLWAKSTEKKTDIWKNIPPSKRRIKDVILDERKKSMMDAKHEKMKKDLKRYKMRTNTQIIVTALITTVTFTVGFTMPGGLHQSGEVDEGLVVLSKRRAFNVFMVSDSLALLLSTSSLFFYFLESINEDPRQVSKLNAASTVLNIVSVMAMMLTFIAGIYVVLSHSPALAITVCVIGSLFFLLIIVLSIKTVYDRKVKRNED